MVSFIFLVSLQYILYLKASNKWFYIIQLLLRRIALVVRHTVFFCFKFNL